MLQLITQGNQMASLISGNICSGEGNSNGIFVSKVPPRIFAIMEKGMRINF